MLPAWISSALRSSGVMGRPAASADVKPFGREGFAHQRMRLPFVTCAAGNAIGQQGRRGHEEENAVAQR